MEMDTTWQEFKNFMGMAINAGEFVGLSEANLSKIAYKVGNFLSDKIDPSNREQRLLKELWDVGTEQERQALASLIVKMVDQGVQPKQNKQSH